MKKEEPAEKEEPVEKKKLDLPVPWEMYLEKRHIPQNAKKLPVKKAAVSDSKIFSGPGYNLNYISV